MHSDSLTRQLEEIRRVASPDGFAGKRQWTRYQADLPMEIREPNSETVLVGRLHNISGGGVGIWSPASIERDAPIEIRLSNQHAWIPGTVVQRSVGIQGYLIGVRFRDPLPTDSEPAVGAETPAPVAPPPRHTPHAVDSGLAAVLILSAVALPVLGPRYVPVPNIGLPEPIQATVWVLLAALIGLLALRRVVRADRTFQVGVARVLTQIAGGHQGGRVPWAPSTAARTLQRSVIRFRDTLRQREEQQRLRRQKLEELNLIKTNILSMVSHDLRTPLTSILLYSQMLREGLDTLPAEDQQQFLSIISNECTRLSRLVDDLLEAQRLESGRTRWRMERVDLADPIRSCAEVFEVMAQSKRITMHLECPDSLPPIEADVDKVAQIVSNLLSNAVKYTPDGGEIRLDVEAHHSEILMRVSDTGPGIPREQWDQIFDRFSQLSATQYIRDLPGVGLGLFIVKQIVERHGGRVWVDSELGVGSSFHVALPVGPTESEDDPQRDQDALARVLVCDADPETTTRIAQMLRAMRYDVRLAHSACRMLSHLEHGDCDVVVTDVLLPDMDAPALIDALTARVDRPYRIVVHSIAGDAGDLRSRGIDIVLPRPATRDEMAQAVRTACLTARNARTVLVVGNDGWRVELLRHGIAEKGWMPILVDRFDEAQTFIGHYPIDLLLLNEDAPESWDEVCQMTQAHPDIRCVVVARQKPRPQTRRLAERYGFELVVHRPGEETELLEQISLEQSTLEALP